METKMNISVFESLAALIARLRGPDGCPWDQEQTAATMRQHLLEESHELAEAMCGNNPANAREELGDVLFLLFFIARIYEEAGAFNLEAAAEEVTAKMTRRHPHVFGENRLDSADAVKKQWAKMKAGKNNGAVDSGPSSLPALMRAHWLVSRSGGNDGSGVFKDLDTALGAVENRFQGLKAALATPASDAADRGLALGALLFDLVQVARLAGIHPEMALSDVIGAHELKGHGACGPDQAPA